MIDRILITGRNRDLPRDAFARTQPHLCVTRIYMAGHEQQIPSAAFLLSTKRHSGMVPESEAGGTRNLVYTHKHCRRAPSRPHPTRLGAHLRPAADLGLMLVAGCLAVSIMTLVLI